MHTEVTPWIRTLIARSSPHVVRRAMADEIRGLRKALRYMERQSEDRRLAMLDALACAEGLRNSLEKAELPSVADPIKALMEQRQQYSALHAKFSAYVLANPPKTGA